MLKSSIFLSLYAGLLPCYAAEFMTGQAARAVIGQTTFVTQVSGGTESTFSGVGGLAFAGNTLFVADANRLGFGVSYPRVMLFTNIRTELPGPTNEIPPASGRCPLCGGVATAVLGDKNSGGVPVVATTQSGMRLPVAVASDGSMVAVADMANNRVLLWKTIPATSAQKADLVLGQSDFTTQNAQPISASSLRGPQGVWIQGGKLFVADTGNHRVLIWNSIPTRNNQTADLVLGQPNFTTTSQRPIFDPTVTASASDLLSPTSVTTDGIRLYVADLGFNRVLIWNSIPTRNQQPAEVVVGQADMAGSLANNSSQLCPANGADSNNNPTYPVRCDKTLNFPRFALPDDRGRLFIADGGNDRVMVYNQIPVTNAAAADAILGQPDAVSDVVTNPTGFVFSSNPTTVSASNVLPTPTSLAWDGTNLYVADATDYRVMVFTPGEPNVALNGVVNLASRDIYATGTITIGGTIVAGNVITVTISAGSSTLVVTASGATLTGGSTTNKATGTLVIAGTAITAGDVATATIGATKYTYTAVSGDTVNSIAAGLVDVINKSNAGAGDPDVTVSSSAATITVTARNTGDAGNRITLNGTAYSYTVLESDTLVTVAKGVADAINSSNNGAGDPNATALFQPNQPVVVLVAKRPGEPGNSITLSTSSNTGVLTLTATPSASTLTGGSGSNRATGTISIAGTTITAGNTVTAAIGGVSYVYTLIASDTLNTVASGLTDKITSSNSGAGDPKVTATASGTVITLTARDAGDAGNSITLSAFASAAASTTATASAGTLTGGANSGNLAPGTFMTIRGSNLADSTETADLSADNLPWELAGVQVYVDGNRAPLFFASDKSINAQMPWEVVNSTSVSVYVRTRRANGDVTVTNAIGSPIAPGAPGLFASGETEPRVATAYHSSTYSTATITITGTIQTGDVPAITVDSRTYSYTVSGGTAIVLTARNLGEAGNSITLAASISQAVSTTATVSGPTLTGGTSNSRASGTVTLAGPTLAAGIVVSVTINGTNYTYTVVSGDTLSNIATGLVNTINAARSGAGDPNVTAATSLADTLATIRDGLINAINGNPEEIVTASAMGVGNGVRLAAKVPGPEGDGIPISTAVTTATTNPSGALLVVTATNSVTCCANVGGAPVTAANPALPGETIYVYATGLGLICTPENVTSNITTGDCQPAIVGTDPAKEALITGAKYKGPAINVPTTPVSANVAGGSATTISAAMVPGSFGIYQVTVELSSSLAENRFTRIYLQQSFAISNTATIPIGPPTR